MNKYLFVWILIAGLTASSCTEPINLRNDGMAPLLVINAILTDTITGFGYEYVSENKVVISKTTPYFAPEYIDAVSGAKVWINSDSLVMIHPGMYGFEKEFWGVPGESYTLTVHYDMNGDGIDEIYTATATMPPKYQLDSLSLIPISWGSDFSALLSLHFQDSVGTDYFGAKLNNLNDIKHAKIYSDRILRYCLFRFELFSNEDKNRMFIPEDFTWIIRHKMRHNNDDEYLVFAGDTLSVQLEALSPEYHRFLEISKTELSQNNPLFSGPRSNLPTNITGGAIGIFGAYTSSSASLAIPIYTPGLPVRP
jgi:hypothetical protein